MVGLCSGPSAQDNSSFPSSLWTPELYLSTNAHMLPPTKNLPVLCYFSVLVISQAFGIASFTVSFFYLSVTCLFSQLKQAACFVHSSSPLHLAFCLARLDSYPNLRLLLLSEPWISFQWTWGYSKVRGDSRLQEPRGPPPSRARAAQITENCSHFAS